MTRLAVPVAILAAALLAGCSSPGPNNPASATITPQQSPYWAGSGIVQSANPAPGPMASAGGTAAPMPMNSAPPAAQSGVYRLGIRMDNGRMMYVDTAERIPAGTRVELTDSYAIKR